VVGVENGAALAVFDDVPYEDAFLTGPRLVAWIGPAGDEQKVPSYEPSEHMRAKMRQYLDDLEAGHTSIGSNPGVNLIFEQRDPEGVD